MKYYFRGAAGWAGVIDADTKQARIQFKGERFWSNYDHSASAWIPQLRGSSPMPGDWSMFKNKCQFKKHLKEHGYILTDIPI